jgi:NitT/TauT family transport system permease protein/taurine transport system permease protein
MGERRKRLCLGGVSVMLALLVWQAVAGLLIPRLYPTAAALLPTPRAVVVEGVDLFTAGSLLAHAWASFQRVLGGVGLVLVTAIPLGIGLGWSPGLRRVMDPLVELIRPISPLAWIPLTLLWFGVSNAQNVSIVFITAFFPLLINTAVGVRNAERTLLSAALTLGADRRQLLRFVVLPHASPYIFAGVRIAFGLGWVAIVAAELVGATSGLGFLIEDSRGIFRSDRIVMSMIVIGLLGALIDRGLRAVQGRIMPWHQG